MAEAGRRARLGCLLALVLLALPVASLARPPGPPGPHGPPREGGRSPGRFIEDHAERLGIDVETRDAIHAISSESRERGRELHAERRAAHDAMHALLSADEPDAETVMAQADLIGALEVESRKNRLRAMLSIRALLSPEQREELVRLREEIGPPRHRRRGGPGPP